MKSLKISVEIAFAISRSSGISSGFLIENADVGSSDRLSGRGGAISWDFLMAKAEEGEEMRCEETLGDVGGVGCGEEERDDPDMDLVGVGVIVMPNQRTRILIIEQ